MSGLLPCVYVPGTPRKASIRMAEHEQALVGASWVGTSALSTRRCASRPVLSQLLLLQSAGQPSFCPLLVDNASNRESRQTTLWCGSCTTWNMEK